MKNNILKLVQSLDALFPIGSYTLSNGMETYVRKGIVRDRDSLEKHLAAYLYMLTFNELAFSAKAFNGADITALDNFCSAIKTPYELRNGSIKQCARFIKIQTELDKYPILEKYADSIKCGICDGHYCIAMGLFIREIGADIEESLLLYCYSIVSSMTNHAVKLVPLRQLDGQEALFRISKKIPAAVKKSLILDETDLGAGAFGFDMRSMQHEDLYSRLYIS